MMTDENLREIARIIEEKFNDQGFVLTLFSNGIAATATNVDQEQVISILEQVIASRKSRPNMKMQ